MKKGE